VSVHPPEVSEELRRRLDLPMTFASDPTGTLMDALGVRHRNAAPPFVTGRSRDLFLPTTFLVDERRTVRWVYRPDTYRMRAPAADVLAEIEKLG
jgi:peroxiredoxin